VGILANNSFHEVEIGCQQSSAGIKDATEVGAIFLFVGSPRLKGDVGHRAMDRDRDGQFQGMASKDDHVLMEGDMVAGAMARCAHGGSTSNAGCNAATIRGDHRTSAMLLKKHLATLGRDVFPIDGIEIPALGALQMLPPPSRLKIPDIGRGSFSNSWFISVGAANHINALTFLDNG
jgi:hypothetical protein